MVSTISASGRYQTDVVSVFALYGTGSSKESVSDFYSQAVPWFHDFALKPDRAGVIGPGHSDKLTSFERIDAKLKKSGFVGIRSIELSCTRPERKNQDEYWATASADIRNQYAIFAIDEGLWPFADLVSSADLERVLAVLEPQYAIAYRMARSRAPELYALGVAHGLGAAGAEYEEARRISRWCDMGMPRQVFKVGLLRDVYPVSFLNQSQLDAKVGRVSLARWIQQDGRRGSLGRTKGGLVRWDVEPAEIPSVFAPLWDAGVIFDWRRHEHVNGF